MSDASASSAGADGRKYPFDPPPPTLLTAASRAALLEDLREIASATNGQTWRLDDVLYLYREGLPRLALARDPHSGALVHLAVDTFGLDGPFWDYYYPVRPTIDGPASLFSWTGAMRLQAPVEAMTFLAKPGPGVPYVVPRLLAHEGVVAVLSTLAVGHHQAWSMAYFANPPLLDHHRFNTWGTNRYHWRGADGHWRWNDCTEDVEVIDGDLAPWIERGKLVWVAPEDAEVTLHSEVEGCPYVGQEGTLAFQRVQFGKVWTQAGPVSFPKPRKKRSG